MSTSGSRTAVAEQSGAKSQVTGLVGAGVVALLLLFFNSLLADLPQTGAGRRGHRRGALAAGPLGAAPLLRGSAASPLALSLVGDPGVVFFGVLQGILVAIVLSILSSSSGTGGRTARCSGGSPAGRLAQRRDPATDAEELPGVVVFRWEAPLFFANSGLFVEQVRSLVREQQARWVVLQCEAMTDIDVTAADMLEQLDKRAQRAGRPPRLRRAAHAAPRPRPTATGCSRPWTATTSTPRSRRRSLRSPRSMGRTAALVHREGMSRAAARAERSRPTARFTRWTSGWTSCWPFGPRGQWPRSGRAAGAQRSS